MKNILIKWQINYFTYLYFLLAFLCGYFKNTCIIFFIIFMHELGHIIMIKFFKYEIISVTFYPFGGLTKINKPINSSINKELFISVSVIIMQIMRNKMLRQCEQTWKINILFIKIKKE